jgi:hypothetical protein
VDSNPAVEETIELKDNLYPDSTIEYTFTGAVDLSKIKTYSFKSYTRLADDNSAYNDTASFALAVYGYPTLDLGPDTLSKEIECTIDAGPGWSSYLWQDGSTDRYFTVRYNQRTPGNDYSCTVTDEHECPASDQIIVSFEVWDITISEILSPVSACVLTNQEEFRIRIKNTGTIAIYNEQIKMVAIIDNGVPRNGQRTLTQVFDKGDSIEFSFGTNFNFSRQGEHPVRVYTIYTKDMDASNDTLDMVIHTWGNPEVELEGGQDTILTSLPRQLDAGPGFEQYSWNGVEGGQIFTVNSPGRVMLEVMDINGCSARDTIYVISTGIEDIPGIFSNLKIYPNPADGQVYIELKLPEYMDLRLEFYDQTGRKIYIREFSNINGIHESVDVSYLQPGIYLLKVMTENAQAVRNIVIL